MFQQSIPKITKNLLIINVLFFLATLVFQDKGIDLTMILGAFFPGSPNFESWQVLSHMFMHGSFSHLFFNMFSLWMFGSVVENNIGDKNFLKLFIYSGFGGFILFNLVNYIEISQLQNVVLEQGVQLKDIYSASKLNIHREFVNEPSASVVANGNAIELVKDYITPMVGASGAIYGLLIAFAVLFPNNKLFFMFLPIGIKAKYFIPIMILIELFMGIRNYEWNNVAHFAHLGGAVIGYFFIKNWKKNLYRRN